MSRLFLKRLYLTPLLAAKQSPRCRFPTRSFNSSATLYNSTTPGTAQNNEVSGNANPRRQWTPQNEDHLIGRVDKLEYRAHSSDERFIASVKDSAALKVDVTKAIGDMCSKMEASMAAYRLEQKTDMAGLYAIMGKIYVELKTDMAALRVDQKTDMAALRVEQKTDMAGLFAIMSKSYVELKTDISRNHGELKSEMGKISTDLGQAKYGIKSLSWQVKAIYGAALVVVGYFATKYPGEFLSFAESILARIPPPQSSPF